MEALYVVAFTVMGAAVGSFLNVCIDRLPDNKSIVYPPSRCAACQRRLSATDLIPVLSYLWLRGRCRYCRAAIPKRILWVEISTAALFPVLYWYYGLGAELAVVAFYFCLFLVILVIDLEKLIVMPMIIIFGLIAAIIFSIFIAESPLVPELTEAAIGGATGLGIFLIIYLVALAIYKGKGFGLGDVYIGTLMGFILGFPNIIIGILLSFWIGGIAAIFLVVLKLRGMKQVVPLGVFLSLGAMATLLWGADILDWYLGYF